MNEKILISITGDEKVKNEIVYNSLMDNMNLSKEQQVKYLKDKVVHLEMEMKNQIIADVLILLSIMALCIGIYLMAKDFFLSGVLIIAITFICVMIRFIFIYRNLKRLNKSVEYDRIEHLRKIMDTWLK